jgi:hypothetical protein
MGGFNQAFQAGLSQQSDKSRLSDEEHQQALQEKNQSIAALQAKMAEVGPNHPEYAGLQDQLSRVMEDRTALYHPNQPGGLERLGAALWEKVHGPGTSRPTASTSAAPIAGPTVAGPMGSTQQLPGAPAGPTVSQRPVTPGDLKQRAASDIASGAQTSNPLAAFRSQYKEAFPQASEEDVDRAVNIHAGIVAKPLAEKPEVWKKNGPPIKDADGNWQQPELNAQGEPRMTALPGYQQVSKQSPSNAAVQRREYAKARYGDENHALTFDDEQNMIKLVKQAGAPTSTTSKYTFVPQKDGSIKAVLNPTTSKKSFGGKPVIPGDSAPTGSLDTMHGQPDGLVKPGTIPTKGRPIVPGPDGGHAEFSTTFEDNDGNTVLVPTIVNGKYLTPDGQKPEPGSPEEKQMIENAHQHYDQTGEHLGVFKTTHDADVYALQLHKRNEQTPDKIKAKVAKAHAAVTSAKAQANDGGTSSTAKPGATVGGRQTPSQTKAQEAYDGARALSTLADDALKNQSAAKDKNLALAIIRGAAGRVNMQEYNILTKRAGLGNSLEAWANSATTGKLPDDIRRQLVGVAKASEQAARAGLDAANGKPADDSDDDEFLMKVK